MCETMLIAINDLSDVEVRRGAAGQCYRCRQDGPLYDILYPHCRNADPQYNGT
ncbi:hypothetical protein [Brevundimonas sp. LM2]|uniref:hypothetical protein n=1 Tax=Brevundimonas sp. LM2 TaxID=1938605 RepID=UPI0015C52B5D|nr:hypothetical protein [Brevundimonas sp. LM2]